MNMRFARLDEIEILMKILEFKRIRKKRKLPVWARQRRDRIEALLKTLEEEAIDISIARELKGSMNLTELVKTTGYSSKRLRARLIILIKEELVKTEKRKNRVFYSLVKE